MNFSDIFSKLNGVEYDKKNLDSNAGKSTQLATRFLGQTHGADDSLGQHMWPRSVPKR